MKKKINKKKTAKKKIQKMKNNNLQRNLIQGFFFVEYLIYYVYYGIIIND